jgi:MFS family permease
METTTTAAAAAPVAAAAQEGINTRKLFVLACLCLATTSMSFAMRTGIAGAMKAELLDPINALTSAQMLGSALSYAFLGFAFTVFIGSSLVDWLGMRNLLALCGLSVVGSVVLTTMADKIAPGAGAAKIVGIGMFLNGLAWGCSETVINPLTTAVYPNEKVHRLNVLHAWWPFGMIVGGLASLGVDSMGLGWRVKFGLLLAPAVAILALLVGTKFPKTERVAAGVKTSEMFMEIVRRPSFLIWFGAMFLTASAELAPGQWVDFALSRTVGMKGIILMIFVAGLMFVMRHFAGAINKKLSSVGLLFFSCLVAAIGLVALSSANSPVTGILTSAIWGTGVCFMWPTMLASVAERYPRGGAFLLGLIGSAGSLAIYFVLPEMGKIYDNAKISAAGGEAAYQALPEAARQTIDAAAATQSFRVVAILPAILLVVFGAIWLNDRRKGGFKAERI